MTLLTYSPMFTSPAAPTRFSTCGESRTFLFAGDSVALAAQIDYPKLPKPAAGYPLLFFLPHAGSPARDAYAPLAQAALASGYAVFRWDLRGTGQSGAAARGSASQDAVNAYEIALEQPNIARRHVLIAAVGSGAALLGSAFGLFARIEHPHGVLLLANTLDEREILALDCPVQILLGAQDWTPADAFGVAPARAHASAYPQYTAQSVLIPNADRLLARADGALHPQAERVLTDWLAQLA